MKYLIPILFLFAACAVVVHPTGGDKDETPPVALKCYPDSQAANFSDNEIRISFDEYFEIKDPNAILLSPPPQKEPKVTVAGKQLRIQFKEPLRENTTYTLQLFDALHDINEKNVLPAYSLSFSTGNEIDTFTISGKVMSNYTVEANKSFTVALFHPSIQDYPDSVIFPLYFSKCLEDGSFSIPSIKNEAYTIYAFNDINNNKRIDQGEEMGYINHDVNAFDTVTIKTGANTPIPPLIYTSPIVLDQKSFILPIKASPYTQVGMKTELQSFDKKQVVFTNSIHKDSLLVQDFIKSDLDTLVTYYLTNNGITSDTFQVNYNSAPASSYTLRLDKEKLLPHTPIPILSRQAMLVAYEKKMTLLQNDTVPVSIKSIKIDTYSMALVYPFKESTSYTLILRDSAIQFYNGEFSNTDTLQFRTPEQNKYGDAAILFSNPTKQKVKIQLLSDLKKEAELSVLSQSDSVFIPNIPTGTYHVRLIYTSDSTYPDILVPFKKPLSKVYIHPRQITIRGGWTIGDFILNNEDE